MLGQIYVTQPLVAGNFAKNRENTKAELCLYVFIPFSSISSKPKWGEGRAQATVRGHGPLAPPPPPRSDGTALSEHSNFTQTTIINIVGVRQKSVSCIIKKQKATGSVTPKRRGKCGRKHKTTLKDDKSFFKIAKKIQEKQVLIYTRIWDLQEFV